MEKTIENISWLESSTNGGNIELKTNQAEEITVSYSTKGLADGYYTAYLYKELPVSIEHEDVAVLTVTTQKETSMNLVMVMTNQETVRCEEDTIAYLNPKDTQLYEMVTVTNGVINIPAGFDGTVYFPFTMDQVNLTTSDSVMLGLITVLPQESDTNFCIKELTLNQQRELLPQCEALSAMGQATIEIPPQGEYTYAYDPGKDADVTFSLAEATEGVSISKEGLLSVSEDAAEGEVDIVCNVSDSVSYVYPVNLIQSWFLSEEAKEQQIYVIPDTAQTITYQKQSNDFQLIKGKMPYITVTMLLLTLGYLAFYRFIIRKK